MMAGRWPIRLIQLLAVAGLLVAFYLFLYHEGSLVVVCRAGGWEDCGRVSGPGAPYAAIGPVPVAAIGLAGYALIFALTWLADGWPALDERLPELLVGLTAIAFLFSLVLTALEAFVIGAYCRYCLVSLALITAMTALAAAHLRALARADA